MEVGRSQFIITHTMRKRLQCTCHELYLAERREDPDCKLHRFLREDAIGFAMWCVDNLGCLLVVYTPEEREKFYRRYRKQASREASKNWHAKY